MRIEKDSWKIVELILRRYPDKKKEYEKYIGNGCKGTGADKQITSTYTEHLGKEIEAVEAVYNSLREEEKIVMRERYWTDRDRNIPYLKMRQSNYSDRQMRRIVHKIIYRVGEKLGEIKPEERSAKIATSQG